jgi:hypothetical protein
MKHDAGEIYINLSSNFNICLHKAVFVTFSQNEFFFSHAPLEILTGVKVISIKNHKEE